MKSKIDINKLLEEAVQKDQNAIKKGNVKATLSIFKKNTDILKLSIKNVGWPSNNENQRAFHNAWLIAQHSDHDPYFQLQCLGLILQDIKENKNMLTDCAFLIDRILSNSGHKQVFGTQLMGKFMLPSTISPKQLESLRHKIGLESMGDYISMMMKQSELLNYQKY